MGKTGEGVSQKMYLHEGFPDRQGSVEDSRQKMICSKAEAENSMMSPGNRVLQLQYNVQAWD